MKDQNKPSRSLINTLTRAVFRVVKRVLPRSQKDQMLILLLDHLVEQKSLVQVLGPERLAHLIDIEAVCAIARTGLRSDECLEAGCLPLPVHFHSPVPDLTDLEARGVWGKLSPMTGLDVNQKAQVEMLLDLGRQFGSECDWKADPTDDPQVFYTENLRFSFGCAASTHTMIRHFKPRHVMEIGSGFSSRVISAALLKNQKETGLQARYTIVDPYVKETVAHLPAVTEAIGERVETLSADFCDTLGDADVLFVDSGHCVRTGSDVNFLILDVLPRLAPGVVVHFHDIPMPYEYSQSMVSNPAFRQFWTESYLLQAFMCLNADFEILLAVGMLLKDQPDEFKKAFPHYNPDVHKLFPSSFWIRRKP